MTTEIAISVTDLTPDNSPCCSVSTPQGSSFTVTNLSSSSSPKQMDLGGTPLDLTFKLSSRSTVHSDDIEIGNTSSSIPQSSPKIESQVSHEMMSESLKSLSELANLQKRFIESNNTNQTYADQLQRVANGPTTLVSSMPDTTITSTPMLIEENLAAGGMHTSQATPTSNFSPLSPPFDIKQICQNIPLQYQLAAYGAYASLWSNSMALALANGQNVQSPFPLLNNPFQSPFPKPASGMGTNDPTVFPFLKDFPLSLNKAHHPFPPVAAPPEVFGISMRGNQKYSSYYQKAYQLGQNSDKNEHSKKTTISNDPYNTTGAPSSSSHSNPVNEIKEKPSTKLKETAFICSCGEEFENLYIFTLHMKDSDHKPRSNQTLRNIPKLVRGQDMWINSETEQTREILRCMHCHQSFPTLPDLTMHMIKTNHYSEIVYSDAGRCLMLNADDKKNLEKTGNSEKRHNSSTLSDDKTTIKQTPDSNSLRKDFMPPKKKSKLSTDDSGELLNHSEVSLSNKHNTVYKSSKLTEVTEADSATADISSDSKSVAKTTLASSTSTSNSTMSSSVSVISQIESFLEKNLPTSNKIENYTTHSTNQSYTKQHTLNRKCEERRCKPLAPYIAPLGDDTNSENPLSSLQKLVETTHKASNESSSMKPVSSTTSSLMNLTKFSKLNTNHSSSPGSDRDACETKESSSQSPSESQTVIMVNPTYIYQPTFSTGRPQSQSTSPTLAPWYSNMSDMNQKQLRNNALSTDNKDVNVNVEDDDEEDTSKASQNVMDLSSNGKSFENEVNSRCNSVRSYTEEMNQTTSHSKSSSFYNSIGSNAGCRTPTVHPSNGTIVKKAKCNYCGKPFANKGQVRLHVSKGKCPSLLQSCHSTGASLSAIRPNFPNRLHMMPGILGAGLFPYISSDYLERLSSLSTQTDLMHNANEENLQRYLSSLSSSK